MKVLFYIANFEYGSYSGASMLYDLRDSNNIVVNELDMVHFVIESEELISVDSFQFILGVNSFLLDESYYVFNDLYYYGLIIDSTIYNLSKKSIEAKNYCTKFSQLFLNNLGYVKPEVIYKENISFFNQIQVRTNKISDANFDIIIKYLMFNNYFDEAVIYKTNLPTDFSDLKNSLLESLKFLHRKVETIVDEISAFKYNSVKQYNTQNEVLPYTSTSFVDNESFNWLFQNLDAIQHVGVGAYDLKINSKACRINDISQVVSSYSFNSYENRVILGYTKLYVLILADFKKNLDKNIILRSRDVGNFYEYLVSKYYEIVELYIDEVLKGFNIIYNYFVTVLKVELPLVEFPKDTYMFVSFPHYKNWFELILLYNNLFSKEIKNDSIKSNLEIESFDRLFEVYLLYLIKDLILINFDAVCTYYKVDNNKNKIAGCYRFKSRSEDDITITLYYEDLPKDIHLLTVFTNKQNIYNPDYVIGFEKDGFQEFLILDAKYKTYNRLEDYKNDVRDLSFKYLHGLGVISKKSKVAGLYLININEQQGYKKVFKNQFDILTSESPVIPSIGGISIDPKDFNLKENLLLDIILKHKIIFENRILEISKVTKSVTK
ncbi:hypothetical protein F6U93_07215 [Tamlana haliotis]|uniref:DUF2357 domain-containing protein n=1 Tax=Pseudotamlana haliotis TaxID=2614804 RepID=A0A6N6MJB0_9FLAO|nr:hypothetical protein [Tamlana haliotis]KAB1068273.1 hypothetical protein F6U93_07215 [Tamlana haliotis]